MSPRRTSYLPISPHSTGTYETDTTLVGDINGDGTVNLADLQPFAEAYETTPGTPPEDGTATARTISPLLPNPSTEALSTDPNPAQTSAQSSTSPGRNRRLPQIIIHIRLPHVGPTIGKLNWP
jgi:hypothetical protein